MNEPDVKWRGMTAKRRASESIIYDTADGQYSIQECENGFNLFGANNTWRGEYPTVERAIDAIVDRIIPDTIARLGLGPEREFGLRNFPGETFRVSAAASYWSEAYGVMLYTQVNRDGKWSDFAKGSPAELISQMVRK